MSRPLAATLVVVLLSCFLLLSGAQIFHDGAVVDEPVHLAAGYSYWFTGDYRLNPEHPPLVKRLAALPLFILPLLIKDCDPSAILTGKSVSARLAYQNWIRALPTGAPTFEYTFGQLFLFGYTDQCRTWLSTLRCRTCVKFAHDCFLNNADLLLNSARLALLCFPILLGLLVFFWSKELWGLGGAFLSLTLFCFDPNYIAYGGLVLTDVPLSCLFFGTVYFFCRFCRRATIYDAALTCLFFSMAQAAKYSALLLVPVLLCLWLIASLHNRQRRQTGDSTGGSSRACALLLLGAGASAYIFLWSQYSFRFTPAAHLPTAARERAHLTALDLDSSHLAKVGQFPLEQCLISYETLEKLSHLYPEGDADPEKQPLDSLELFQPQTLQRMEVQEPSSLFSRSLLFAATHHLLPQAYLYGLAYVREYAVYRRSYLFGELSVHSFPSYFFWTFLLKSTLPCLALLCGSVALLSRRRQLWRWELLFLLVPVIIYFWVAVVAGLNIGHRHLLPIYPFLYVLIGCLIKALPPWQTRQARVIAAATLAAVAVSSSIVFAPLGRPALVYPDYLPYFNELAGGPDKGWESLLDSNLEFGQSLKYLSAWLTEHRITNPIYLCWVGGDDPTWEGIAHQQVLGGRCYESSIPVSDMANGNYLAISVSKLVGLNMPPRLNKMWSQFIHDRCTFVDMVDHCLFIFRIDKNPLPKRP